MHQVVSFGVFSFSKPSPKSRVLTVQNTLNGHQTTLKNNDTGILHEVDVGDTYNARGVQFTCTFFELCTEAAMWWYNVC
jgi:hypothetical protein